MKLFFFRHLFAYRISTRISVFSLVRNLSYFPFDFIKFHKIQIEYGGYDSDEGAEPTSVPRVGVFPDNNTEPDDMRSGRRCVGGDDDAYTGYSVGQGDEGDSVGGYGEDAIPRK